MFWICLPSRQLLTRCLERIARYLGWKDSTAAVFTRASYNGISRWSIFLSYINYRPISPSSSKGQTYTQRNLFGILLNQTKIRLYLPYTDTFGTKRTYVWFQINQCIVNTIWFRFDLIRFRKDFKCTNMGIFFKERNSTLYPA